MTAATLRTILALGVIAFLGGCSIARERRRALRLAALQREAEAFAALVVREAENGSTGVVCATCGQSVGPGFLALVNGKGLDP